MRKMRKPRFSSSTKRRANFFESIWKYLHLREEDNPGLRAGTSPRNSYAPQKNISFPSKALKVPKMAQNLIQPSKINLVFE